MNYKEFKMKYQNQINEEVKNDDLIELGSNKWMDLLSIVWDDKNPYDEEATNEDVIKAGYLEKYLTECNIEVC